MCPGPGRPLAPGSGLRPSSPPQWFGPGWESKCPWMGWACWGQRSGEGCNPTCPPRSQAPQCPVSLSISFPISRSPQRPLSGQKLPPVRSPQHEGGCPFPICLGQDPEMKGCPCQGQTPRGPKGWGVSRRGQPWPRDLFWPCVPTPVVTNHPPSPPASSRWGPQAQPGGAALQAEPWTPRGAEPGSVALPDTTWPGLRVWCGSRDPLSGYSCCLVTVPGRGGVVHSCGGGGLVTVLASIPAREEEGAPSDTRSPPGAVALIRVPPAATGPAGLWGSSSQSQRAGNFLLPRRASHGGGSDFPARTSLPRPSTSHSGCLLGPRGRGVMAVGAPRPLPGL